MKFSIQVLSMLATVGLVSAAALQPMYYMDDTDPTINYKGQWVPLNASFTPITWANASLCHNKTFTVGQGYTHEQNSVSIPFTGTGISLFVAYNNRLGLNASITLDNNLTTINWFILDTDYTTPTITTYNATLYDIQNLEDGEHEVVVTIQDYRGNQSDMMFDYAAVSGTRSATSGLGSSGGSSIGKKIGAGIGGGLGALAILSALALLLLFSRRRRHRRNQMTHKTPSNMELDLIDRDAKDPSLFQGRGWRPSHNRHQSNFSESSTMSPISPVKPAYSNFLGQKHPFVKLPE